MRRHLAATARLAMALAVLSAGAGANLRAQAAPQAPAAEQLPLEQQTIRAVRLIAETGALLEENPANLPVQPGQKFDAEAIRESLIQLHRTGRFADIRVEAFPSPAGTRLDFVVRPNLYVNVVRVAGLPEPPGEAWALSSLRLGLGEPFRESILREGLERLRQSFREEGFYQAELSYSLDPHPATRQMDIAVRVAPGPRARLGAIRLAGPDALSTAKLMEKTRLKPGREISTARLEHAAERIRRYVVRQGRLGARVTMHRGEYDRASNQVPLGIEVAAGPKVRVEVTGAHIPGGALRKLLPIYLEATVDEDLLQEGRRNLRDHLEHDGYFDSEVRYARHSDETAGQESITYGIERGARRRLVGVSFQGNSYFSADLLRGRLRIQTARFLFRGRFRRSLLEDDVNSIRDLYVSNGFRQAEVIADIDENHAGRAGHLYVRFRIRENAQTRIADLILEGNHAFRDDELLAVIGSTPGQPYSEFNVSGDRDNILALYFNEGFPAARFEWQTAETPGANRVRLTYRIAEGPQVHVQQVLLAGYSQTREGVIAREVHVKPGEPLREGDVVETQRRLYNLGVFSRVSLAPQNPAGTETDKSLVVLVEEGKRYTLAYGLGIEVQRLGGGADPVGGEVRASPRGLFELTRANFTGRAHTVAFKVRVSSLQSRALLSYIAPNFLGVQDLSLLLTAFADRTRDVRTFTSTRYEASTQLAQRVSLVSSLFYRFSFRRVLVDATSLRVSPDQVPLFSQPTKISGPGVTWIRERRDNPADATRGDYNNVDISLAAKPLASSASFLRLFFQNSTFHPLGRGVVFARSARFGLQEPLSDTVPNEIPLPERFFAGGGNSLRGFGLNQSGPRDSQTGFPVGGLAMLVFNQELRFPMRLPRVGSRVGGALLYDAGNVFSRANRITLRSSPARLDDLNYFSHTIGFGFRYATPIGPVRLDLGYLLNPARFSFRDAQGMQRLSRLPRFQFFFNIGSIF